MRIRKRQVPFPLSSLSPVPLSDLQFHQSPPVVQLQLHNINPLDDTAAYFDPPPSSTHQSNQPIREPKDYLKDERRVEEGERSNDIRKESFLGAETESIVILQQPNSSQQGRWYEGEKAVPLKKRRGNFERRSNYQDNKKMKTKMNKKCLESNDEEMGEDNKESVVDVDTTSTSTSNVKKRVRGGALMEGSRCSRVNGRGWRCCQQTLVGYSLCEHHLGKGRLRSMTNVRNRSKAAVSSQALSSNTFSSSDDKELQKNLSPPADNVEDHAKKPMMKSKRKVKLGIVKARSISSLLGQANSAISVEEDSK